jgi:hypothetical protein
MSRTRRTPQQMIEEQQARLDKLKEKAALDTAKQSPELVQIVEAIQQETKAIQEAQRGLGSGPQSFDARIKKHDAWTYELEAAKSLSSVVLSSSTERKDYLSDALSSLSEKLAEGSDVSVEVLEILASIPSSASLSNAKATYEQAHSHRKAVINSKKKEA